MSKSKAVNTSSGTRPKAIATAGPKAVEQYRKGETASQFRKQHGDIRLVKVVAPEDGNLVVAQVSRDYEQAWLSDALALGKITEREALAGDEFAHWGVIHHATGYTRSCIDDTPRGMGGNGNSKAIAAGEMGSMQNFIIVRHGVGRGMGIYWLLVDVLVKGIATGRREGTRKRWQDIREGLDAVADMMKLPR